MRLKKRTSIVDVAQRAGVSKTTAGYVLARKEPYFSQYTADTIGKVERAARALGYSPNLFAASLRLGESLLLGVYFDFDAPAGGPPIHGVSQFLWDIFSGITQASIERGCYPVLIARPSIRDFARAEEELNKVARIPFGGMIVFARDPLWNRVFAAWDRSRVPCIRLFGRGRTTPQPWTVDLDNAAVGRMAARAILQRGHRNVLYLTEQREDPAMQERLAGFLAGMTRRSAAGINVTSLCIPDPREFDDAPGGRTQAFEHHLTEQLRHLAPTAIFAPSGGLATLIASALQNLLRIDVPSECLVVGLDVPWELPVAHRILQVHCPGYEIGRLAVDLLYARIEGKHVRNPVRLVRPQLIEPRT